MRAFAFCVLAAAVAALGCGKATPPADAPGAITPTASDRERLQGVWRVEWIDGGGGSEAEMLAAGISKEEVATYREHLRKGRTEFKGDRVIMTWLDMRGEFVVVLDETKQPKWMTLTEIPVAAPKDSEPVVASDPRPPEKREWIYKLDGDLLIVAYVFEGERPTELKARARKPGVPHVNVMTMKKLGPAELEPRPDAPARPKSESGTAK